MNAIYPQLPSGYVIFCDDVRQEVTGKNIYIGVYNSRLIVAGDLPITLAKLCTVICFRDEPQSTAEVIIKIMLQGSSGTESVLAEMNIGVPEAEIPAPTDEWKMREITVHFQFSPVQIEEEGRISVRALRGDDEFRLGALVIEQGVPTILEPL